MTTNGSKEIHFSSYRRAENDIKNASNSADRIIEKGTFYVIAVEFETCLLGGALAHISKECLNNLLGQPHKPFVIYHMSESEVFLAFSSVGENDTHNFNGSQHLILSHCTSVLTKTAGVLCTCRIIEFQIRTQILLFFTLTCCSQYQKIISPKVGESIGKLSFYELSKKEQDIKDTLSSHEKWGTFYRKGGDSIITRTKPINAVDVEEFQSFLFNRYKDGKFEPK